MFGLPEAVAGVSNLVTTAIEKIWPDPTEKDKLKLDYLKSQLDAEMKQVIGQIDINKSEAGHASVFVAGWRPFVGWVCAMSLLYASFIEPFLEFVAVVIFGYEGGFPIIDTDITLQVLIGMLGLGVFRSFDKANGVARESL